MDRKILLILVAGLTLRLLSFVGLVGSDDLIYTQAAYNLVSGEDFALGNPGANRWGLILPLAAVFKLGGVNEASTSLITLIPSLLLIFLIYHAAKNLFSREVGWLAALFLAVYPMDVIYSTMLYPDLPMSLFTGLGVYLFYRGGRDERRSDMFFSGVCVGLAYSIKMNGVFAAPFLIGYSLYIMRREGRVIWDVLLVPLGFLVIFGSELLAFHVFKGDMLYRFHSLPVHNKDLWSGIYFYREHGYLARLIYMFPRNMLFQLKFFGLFYWATFPAMAYLLLIKEKRAYFPIAWWLALYLTLNFGTTSLSEYTPLFIYSRYTFMLLLPANLILAAALWRLIEGDAWKKWTRFAGYSTIVVLLLSSIQIIAEKHERGTYVERLISEYFNGNPDKPIYTDSRTKKILIYYFKYKNQDMIRDFSNLQLKELKSSYVVVNIPLMRVLSSVYKRRFNPALFRPPPSWRPVAIMNRDYGPSGSPLLNNNAAIIYSVE